MENVNDAITARIKQRGDEISALKDAIEQRRGVIDRESAQLQTDMVNLHRHQAALAQLHELLRDLSTLKVVPAVLVDDGEPVG